MSNTTIRLISIIKKHTPEKEYREAVQDSARQIIKDCKPEEREVICDLCSEICKIATTIHTD